MSKEKWQTDEFTYGIKVLLDQKPKKKSIMKAAEEFGELAVKLLQYLNKPGRVPDEDVQEEIADCEMHLIILKHYFKMPIEVRRKKIAKFLNSSEHKKHEKNFKKKNI